MGNVAEDVIAGLIAETVVETAKYLFQRTGPTIDEIFQLSKNIYDNLKKHMDEEEFEEKKYKLPRSRVGQAVEKISEGTIRPTKYSYGYYLGWQSGRLHYQENKEEYDMLESEEIIPLIPKKNIFGQDEKYVNGYKAGIEHEIHLREIETKRNERQQMKEEERRREEIEETNANAEIEIATIESILALKQGERNKVTKTLGVTEQHLEGMLIALKNIEENGGNFQDKDYAKLADEYRGNIVNKDIKEGIAYGVMRYKLDQDELESILKKSPMLKIDENAFKVLTKETKKRIEEKPTIEEKERKREHSKREDDESTIGFGAEVVNKLNEEAEKTRKEEEKRKQERRENEHTKREESIKLLQQLLSGEPEPKKLFISPDALKRDIYRADKEFAKGRLEGLKFIQENEKDYYKTEIDKLLSEAEKRIENESDSFKDGYLGAIEEFKKAPGDSTKIENDVSLLDISPEAVSSLVDFHKQLEGGNIEGASASLASLTTNLATLSETLTGENAESIKTAVSQFGEFSEKMMRFVGGDVSGVPALASPPTAEELAVPAVLTITDANLVAQQVIAQLKGEVPTTGVEKTVDQVTHEDLGIEIRDAKRSTESDMAEVKSILQFLLKLIKEKALTFEDIYQMLARRMARDHEMQTGRKIVY